MPNLMCSVSRKPGSMVQRSASASTISRAVASQRRVARHHGSLVSLACTQTTAPTGCSDAVRQKLHSATLSRFPEPPQGSMARWLGRRSTRLMACLVGRARAWARDRPITATANDALTVTLSVASASDSTGSP